MSDRLVELARFSSTIEASIARGLLDAEGIDALLSDEGIADMHLGPALGGVRLIVREDDVERASAILHSAHGLAEDQAVDFDAELEQGGGEPSEC